MCFNLGCLQPYAIIYQLTTLCKKTGVILSFCLNMNEIWIAFNVFSRYIAVYH
uniref:Uncharacterized protein n=1 Tax=Romanomermis culicivorax TaxID=13658 RepID=A0A915KMQ3_ROMCU